MAFLKLISSLFALLLLIGCNNTNNNLNDLNDISSIIKSDINQTNKDEYIVQYRGYKTKDYLSLTTKILNYNYNPLSEFVLLEDTVYKKNTSGIYEKFTGTIRVIGKLNRLNEYLKNENIDSATLALFKIKEGIFEGKQLYHCEGNYRSKIGARYYYTEIKPFMDAVRDRDYIEVEKSEMYDFSFGSDFSGYKYYRINRPTLFSFDISTYWESGKLFYSRKYLFSMKQFVLSSLNNFAYNKDFLLNDSSSLHLYHYNGNLAFNGKVDKENIFSEGKYFTFNNIETDLKHFKLQKSFDREIDFDRVYDIADEDFKEYRKYFGILENVLYENSNIETKPIQKKTPKYNIETIVNKSDYVCGMPFSDYNYINDTLQYNNFVYGFCSEECKNEFKKNPNLFIKNKYTN